MGDGDKGSNPPRSLDAPATPEWLQPKTKTHETKEKLPGLPCPGFLETV